MPDNHGDIRLTQLLRSPGGCALLIKMDHANMTPTEAVEPQTAIHLVANAVGALNPWDGVHDRIVDRLLRDGQEHIDLARALLTEPGIERWWAPLDHEWQVWMQPWADAPFLSPDAFPTPTQPPGSWEQYAQKPERQISTSTRVGSWTSQLATCTSGQTDWYFDYRPARKLVRVSPDARVLEIVTADDWHDMVVAHGFQSDRTLRHSDVDDVPWGANDGLVPDWASIAREWDGVHVTLWAFLTGTQTRVTSKEGWTEMWSGGGEETTWLRWSFDGVEDLAPVNPIPGGQQWPLPFRIPNPYGVYIHEQL